MYVCICHGVTDKQIRAAAGNGANSLESLSAQLRVATCCGRCADCAREILQDEVDASALPANISTAAA